MFSHTCVSRIDLLENTFLSQGTLVFPSPKKPTLLKFQIGLEYMDTFKQLVLGLSTPQDSLQIILLRIDREGMIDDVISYSIWRHLCKKYLLTRSSWICDVPHYCAHCNHIIYHTKVYEETFNVSSIENSSNIANYLKVIVRKLSLQLNGKLWWISRRFRTLIWRPGDTVQNLESPGLSGRVDGTVVHIRNPKVLPG